jgi:selenocysteine-specific elongation factor
VQLLLENPVVPARGDRIVLRKYSPPRVMGGGVVVDPHPTRHKRFDADALEQIRVHEAGDPGEVLSAALTQSGAEGLAVDEVAGDLRKVLEARGAASTVGGRLYSPGALERLARNITDLVGSHLAGRPLQWGMDKEELRRRVGFPHGPAVFNRVLDFLAGSHAIEVRENRVRCGDKHSVPENLRGALDDLETAIRSRGVAFATRSEIAAEWREKENAPLGDAIGWLRETGRVVELGDAGIIHTDALSEARAGLLELLEDRDAISVGDYKDRLGLSRKHAIPLLEHFDGLRVTARSGNTRIRGSAFPR